MSNTGTKEPSPQPSTAHSPPEPQRRGRGRPRKQQQVGSDELWENLTETLKYSQSELHILRPSAGAGRTTDSKEAEGTTKGQQE